MLSRIARIRHSRWHSTLSAEPDFQFAVIGAGVVGLAIAASLSRVGSLVLLERNKNFGQETSSRNSEVLHAGIYYPESCSLASAVC
jgi:L-2-hydroxyglutarate oxidase LhgO